MMAHGYSKYFDDVRTATCARNLRGLLNQGSAPAFARLADRTKTSTPRPHLPALAGPPTYFSDENVMPVADGEHVHELLYTDSGAVASALLPGASLGEERQAIWDALKEQNEPRIDTMPETE
jgi:hypothetical protein